MNGMQSLRLSIDGMTCSNCVNHVDNALSAMDEVHEIMTTLHPEGTSHVVITLNSEVSEDKLREVIDEAGYTLVGVEKR
ncbi:MAG TPA: heavy-metal-associated domain-containing protein [Actinomycetales bacterium]|nr:heavy-metal-associated domain-containing protein [Actinomycetales bacterium]